MLNPYLDAALLIWIYMTAFFVLALIRRDNGLADIGWGLGFTLVAWWLHGQFPYDWSLLPTILVSLWGIRLALHIGVRNARKSGEDWRYAKWRRDWGRWFIPRSYLQVFMLQGALMWIISTLFMHRPAADGIDWYQWLGVGIWAVGFTWEAVSDWQLMRFKANPANKGKIMTEGLWRLSRHPNYFGEIVLWWGLWLVLLPNGPWWLGLISPITVTWLLTRVSGVPMLEGKYKDNPEYQAYVERTPALFPGKRSMEKGK